MADHASYWHAAIAGAMADFEHEAGPGNINNPLIRLACRLIEIANTPDSPLTLDEAEAMACDAARKLGHAEANITATWRSAMRRVGDRAAMPPRDRLHRNHACTPGPITPGPITPGPITPGPITPGPMPGAYADLDAYAAAHGVTGDVYRAADWRDATLWEAHGRLSETRPPKAIQRRAIRFDTDAGPRWRLIDGLPGPKYWHPAGTHTGSRRVWYRLDAALTLAARAGYLVLANGEASVVVAQHYGVPATTVAGGGEHAIPDHLMEMLQSAWSGPIVVALEGDATGCRAAEVLVRQLHGAGYDARAVDLGLSGGEDLADFCARHREASIHTLVSLPDRSSPATIRVYWGDAIDQVVAPRQLVRGYLTLGTVALLVGASESGKSTIAVNLACTVAQHYPVLYVAGEDAGNVRAQIRAWELETGIRRGQIGLIDGPVALADPARADELLTLARRHGVRLIVLDTLSTCTIGVDENGADMTAVIARLNAIADAIDGTVLAIHHPIKSDAVQYRGHSSLLNNTHTMMVVEREPLDDRIRVTVTRHKGRRADPAWFYVRERETDIVHPDDGNVAAPVALPTTSIQAPETLSGLHRQIVRFVYETAAEGVRTAELIRSLTTIQGLRVSEPTIRRALSRLVTLGYMMPAKSQTEARVLTPLGEQVAIQEIARDQPERSAGNPFVVNPWLNGEGHTPDPSTPPTSPSASPSTGASTGTSATSSDEDLEAHVQRLYNARRYDEAWDAARQIHSGPARRAWLDRLYPLMSDTRKRPLL